MKPYLAQNQRPVSSLLTFNKLVRPQSHTFSQTGDDKCICDLQQRQILTERQILCVQEYDRLIRQCRESGVDPRNHVRYRTGGGSCGCCRRGLGCLESNLDQNNLALERRVSFQERLKCCELVSYTLDFVQLVSPDEDFHARITLFKYLNPFSDVRFLPIQVVNK